MATLKRLTLFRTLVCICSMVCLVVPGILLYDRDSTISPRPQHMQQYIKFPARKQGKNLPRVQLRQASNRGEYNQGRQPLVIEDHLLPKLFISPVKSAYCSSVKRKHSVMQLQERLPDSQFNTTGIFRVNTDKAVSDKEQQLRNLSAYCTKEVQKVAFVKTHKTGSTTILNVIQRFGHTRELVFALPKSLNYLGFGETVKRSAVEPPPRGKTYDLLVHHVVYNREAFRLIMPPGTTYVTIIRHPLEQFVSAVEYLKNRLGYLKKLPQGNLASWYLRDPSSHEPKDFKWSFTNNRMSFDLGLHHTLYHDEAAVSKFINALDKDFKLVMITEHFDESLLLLKKYLCWSYKDILYIPRNVNKKKMAYNFTTEDKLRHKRWASADYKLYDFFLKRFWEHVSAEGAGFFEELIVFQEMLAKVRTHCHSRTEVYLKFPETKWNEGFSVEPQDCEYMLLEEVPFLLRTRTRQIRKRKGVGMNRSRNVGMDRRRQVPVKRSALSSRNRFNRRRRS